MRDVARPLALMPEEDRPELKSLLDLSLDLVEETAGLGKSVPKPVRRSLSRLVRGMNCYYSNLIDRHNTLPRDILCATCAGQCQKANWKPFLACLSVMHEES